jgi:hypothetical protein
LPGCTAIPGRSVRTKIRFFARRSVPIYIEHALSFQRMYRAGGIMTARKGGGIQDDESLDRRRPDMLVTADT